MVEADVRQLGKSVRCIDLEPRREMEMCVYFVKATEQVRRRGSVMCHEESFGQRTLPEKMPASVETRDEKQWAQDSRNTSSVYLHWTEFLM